MGTSGPKSWRCLRVTPYLRVPLQFAAALEQRLLSLVTADGLVLCVSAQISGDSADQLAAITSGLASLTDGAALFFAAGSVRQLIVEMDEGFLLVARVSDGSVLAVMCESSCDIGLIGYEMSLLIGRIGGVLTPELRARLRPPVDLGNVTPT